MSAKQQQEIFNSKVDSLLSNFKAQKQENVFPQYILSTSAGKMEIHVHLPQRSNVFSIYCKVEDKNKAGPHLRDYENYDPYTGKFNFHGMNYEWVLSKFEAALKKIIN